MVTPFCYVLVLSNTWDVTLVMSIEKSDIIRNLLKSYLPGGLAQPLPDIVCGSAWKDKKQQHIYKQCFIVLESISGHQFLFFFLLDIYLYTFIKQKSFIILTVICHVVVV